MNNWRELAIELSLQGKSWRSVAVELDKPKSTVSDFLRRYYKEKGIHDSYKDYLARRKSYIGNERVLLISDMHMPYHHKDTLDFLYHLKNKYSPTKVVCLGDEVDHHCLSYHDTDPDLYGASDELQKAILAIKDLQDIFPEMNIIESNHGSLMFRKAKTHGIPKHYIKPYNEVLGVGDKWVWSYDLTLTLPNGSQTYIHHGKTTDVIKLSQQMGMNAVQGHYHEKFKIDYWGNPFGLYWGMNCGCLIDDNSLAFAYNNVNIKRPTIGTGVIIESLPILEPMVLGNDGRWLK